MPRKAILLNKQYASGQKNHLLVSYQRMDKLNSPLFDSVYGQIRYCSYAAEFGIDFGEMQVWMSQDQLRLLAGRINWLVAVNQPLHQLPTSYHFTLCPPGSEGEFYHFSTDELLDLQNLVSGAMVMIELYRFLDMHQFVLKTTP